MGRLPRIATRNSPCVTNGLGNCPHDQALCHQIVMGTQSDIDSCNVRFTLANRPTPVADAQRLSTSVGHEASMQSFLD